MINWIYLIFLGTCGWGCSLYFIKTLLLHLSPVEIVFYRMAIGAITLVVLVIILNIKMHNFKFVLIDGLMMGIFNMTIPFYLTTFAEKSISSALASVLNGLTPLFTFLLGISFFSLNQRYHLIHLLSITLGFVGVLSINFDFHLDQNQLIALLALTFTSISYAIAANYLKLFSRSGQPLVVAAIAACVSTIIMFFWMVIEEPRMHWHIPLTINQIFSLFWLGVMGSGLCLYLYFVLIEKIGALNASMVTYLMTATGVFMGVTFLHERMSMMNIVGCVCIIVSLILNNHADQLKKIFTKIWIVTP